jgi:hypothetical protein
MRLIAFAIAASAALYAAPASAVSCKTLTCSPEMPVCVEHTPGHGQCTAGHVLAPSCLTITCQKGFQCEQASTCPAGAKCIWAGTVAHCVKTETPKPAATHCKTMTCPKDKPHCVQRGNHASCTASDHIFGAPTCAVVTCAPGLHCVMESNCPPGAECFAYLPVSKCVK